MIPWIDVALRSFAVISTIVATLRAGSRMLYIAAHQSIGVMNGPMILPPNNNNINSTTNSSHTTGQSYALYELSESFKHCVRLSVAPSLYQNVQQHVPHADTKGVDRKEPFHPRPYSLGTSAYTPRTFRRSKYSIARKLPTPSVSAVPDAPEVQNETVDTTTTPPSKWDYGLATEADFYYNISTSAVVTNPRRRLAQLTVYCPKVFENLRSVFGISEESYLRSILDSGPFVSFQSNSKGAARVGGVFFFTRDGAYMIKTIKKEEAETLLRMLPRYHRHLKRHGRSSLLTRFCGMYQVKIEEEEEDPMQDPLGDRDDDSSLAPTHKVQTFVVMNAVFPADANRFILERFDLKGSTVGREVSEEELLKKGTNAVMKDLDLAREVELMKSKGGTRYGLNVGATRKAALLSQLREDVKLLVDCQVMDYSLLVGIVLVDYEQRRNLRKAVSTIREQSRILDRIEGRQSAKVDSAALYAAILPLRLMIAPPLYLARKAWVLGRLMLDSIFTTPLPYYGSGSCVVDGGTLSVLHGERRGERAIYYMGLIDFLQPWTKRKVMERFLKGVIGYDTKAVSAVTPEEYAARFLTYLGENVT